MKRVILFLVGLFSFIVLTSFVWGKVGSCTEETFLYAVTDCEALSDETVESMCPASCNLDLTCPAECPEKSCSRWVRRDVGGGKQECDIYCMCKETGYGNSFNNNCCNSDLGN